jgi:Tfp pilus assembly PilM family ATPase
LKLKLKRLNPLALRTRLSLGIDVTETAVRGVLMNVRREEPVVLRWYEVPVEQASGGSEQNDAWIAALKKLLKEFNLANVHVSISLPPSGYFISLHHLPNLSDQKVGEAIFRNLEEQKLPFPVEKATISYTVQPGAPKGTYVVVCAEKSRFKPVFSALHHAGAVTFFLLPADLPIRNCIGIEKTEEEEETSVTLRLGRRDSVLTFFDAQGFRLRRVIPIGREDFLKKLISDGFSPARRAPGDEGTEEFRIVCFPVQAVEGEDGPERKAGDEEIYDSIQPVLNRLVSSILKTFHFYGTHVGKSSVNRLHLTGDCRGLLGIDAFLDKRLQVSVGFLDSLRFCPLGDKVEEELPSPVDSTCYTAAVGNALEESGELSLVPREELFLPRIRLLRTVSRLTAGLLCVGMLLLTAFYIVGFRKLEEPAKTSEAIADRIETLRRMEQAVLMVKQQNLITRTIVDEIVPAGRFQNWMKELSRLVPEFVSLDNLELTCDREESLMKMAGIIAVDLGGDFHAERARFVDALEASRLFENISIHSEEIPNKKNCTISRFSITASVIGEHGEGALE